MAAAGAIWRTYSIDGSIQWLKIEALDVLHWVMHPALYRCIAMAIEIAINFPSFFVTDN